jgi:hypothetical protein
LQILPGRNNLPSGSGQGVATGHDVLAELVSPARGSASGSTARGPCDLLNTLRRLVDEAEPDGLLTAEIPDLTDFSFLRTLAGQQQTITSPFLSSGQKKRTEG